MGDRDSKGGRNGGRDGRGGTSARAGELGESKVCPQCGLPFSNRKKWASRGLWADIVYCSERCRRDAAGARRRSPP